MGRLAINSVIETVVGDRVVAQDRVLWVSPDGRDVVVISLLNPERALPVFKEAQELRAAIANGDAVIRTTDPVTNPVVHTQFKNDKQRRKAQKLREMQEKAWNAIKDLVCLEPDIYDPRRRGPLLAEASRASGTTVKTYYKYLRRYWIGGKVPAALRPHYDRYHRIPRKCASPKTGEDPSKPQKKRGRPSKLSRVYPDRVGVNVDDRIRAIFEIAAKKYYDTRERYPVKKAFDKMNQNHFCVGQEMRDGVLVPILAAAWERPTIGQFRYFLKRRPQTKISLIKRYGEDEYEQNMRAITGDSSIEAFAPGVIWQVDSSSTNVKIVNRLDRQQSIGVGRVYIATDVFAHIVTGVRVGLGGPSWTELSELLANAMTDKVSFCARYNITITDGQWPCHHIPQTIRTDRGSEYTGWDSDSLITELGISVIETPTHRPELKGLVERIIGVAKQAALYWLPGTTYDPRSWKKAKPKEDACLDLDQLTYIVIQEVIAYNTATWLKDYKLDEQMTMDRVDPIPVELWKYGLTHRQGNLSERGEVEIKIALLRKARASVTAQGILFKRDYYTCERAIREQWFETARREGRRWQITVAYDSRLMDRLYVRTEDGSIEVLRPLASSRVDMLRKYYGEELDDIAERDAVDQAIHQSTADQIIAERDAKIQQKVTEAKEMVPPKSRRPSRRGDPSMLESRRAERQRRDAAEAWTFGDTSTERGGKVIPYPAKGDATTDVEIRSPSDRALDELLGLAKDPRKEDPSE